MKRYNYILTDKVEIFDRKIMTTDEAKKANTKAFEATDGNVKWEKDIKMNECIINGKNICPHVELSGKLCSACKEPDRERLSIEWYHFLCLNVPCFRDLSMDRRGKLTAVAIEHHLDAMKNTPEIMGLTSKDQKIMILEIMEDIC